MSNRPTNAHLPWLSIAPEERSQALVQALTPQEYPQGGGFARAHELLAAGIRLDDTDWYHLVIAEAWDAIRLNADHQSLPSPEQMSSCLAYALEQLIPAQKLAGIQALLYAIEKSPDPTFARRLERLVQLQEHMDCARRLGSSADADARQAGQLFGQWLDAQANADRHV